MLYVLVSHNHKPPLSPLGGRVVIYECSLTVCLGHMPRSNKRVSNGTLWHAVKGAKNLVGNYIPKTLLKFKLKMSQPRYFFERISFLKCPPVK